MTRRHVLLIAILPAVLFHARAARAQSIAGDTATGCSYATCALRFEADSLAGISFARDSRRASVLLLLGVVAEFAVVARTDGGRGRIGYGDVVVMLASLGFTIASVRSSLSAERSLSRAIWWYNSTLPR